MNFDEYDLIASVTRESFYEFFVEFWSEVIHEPLKLNWHIKYLADVVQRAAERVFAGEPKKYDIIINVPPGSTKPVWEKMPILMGDGTWKSLDKIKQGDFVIGKSGKPCLVSKVHQQGMQDCVKIRTVLGREIICALDHPILTAEGWIEAGKILPDHILALRHKENIRPSTDRTDEEFKLAGYLVGDGCVVSGNCDITSGTPTYVEDLLECLEKLNFGWRLEKRKYENVEFEGYKSKGVLTVVHLKCKSGSVKRSGMKRGAKGVYFGPRKWIREKDIRLFGKCSYTKRVPPFVWKGSNIQIALFLASYFHCDGHISYRVDGRGGGGVEMTTVSRQLARDLQRLFLRLGISMRIRRHEDTYGKDMKCTKNKKHNPNSKGYVSYQISCSSYEESAKFLSLIPIKGYKAERLRGALVRRQVFEQEYLPDRVVSVNRIGKRKCRCLTVKGDESFVVSGVVVHNSTLLSIMLPAWIYTRMPSARCICASHTDSLVMDLSRKCRDVVLSEKYQACFGVPRKFKNVLIPGVQIQSDQNTKGYWATTEGGMRFCATVGGKTPTGFHGHFLITDDPIDPQKVLSEIEQKDANRWMRETLPTRKVDKSVSVSLLIMQRLHQADPAGDRIENKKAGKVKIVCLPAEESSNIKPFRLKEKYVKGLLDPIRLSKEVLEEQRETLGEFAYSGQYQQRPVPLGGGLFKWERFDYGRPPEQFVKIVRYWDTAGGIKSTHAYTAGVKMGKDVRGEYWILDVKRGRWASEQREAIILQTAKEDGRKVKIGIERQGGSSGMEVVKATIKNLAGFIAVEDRPTGKKQERAIPFSVQVNNGHVHIAEGKEWSLDYIAEAQFFPNSRFLDQMDASSGAFNMLTSHVVVGGLKW